MTTPLDAWEAGFRAGLDGAAYANNPLEGTRGATAWAFGCSEGLRERNRRAVRALICAMGA